MKAITLFISAIVLATSAHAAEDSLVDKTKSAVHRGAKATAHGIERGARAAGHGIEVGLSAAGRGIKRGAEATRHALHKASEKFGGSNQG